MSVSELRGRSQSLQVGGYSRTGLESGLELPLVVDNRAGDFICGILDVTAGDRTGMHICACVCVCVHMYTIHVRCVCMRSA